MKRNEALIIVTEELEKVGLEWRREQVGGHLKIKWHMNGAEHMYVVATTSVSRRALLNVRADMRRMLKVYTPPAKPVFTKAMSTPKPVESMADRLDRLEAKIDELTDLLLEVLPSRPQPRTNEKRDKVLLALDFIKCRGPSDIARETGLPKEYISYALNTLKAERQVMNVGHGLWRRMPVNGVSL